MELRIQAARTTRDIDLASRRLPGGAKEWDEAAIRNLLEAAAGFDLGDSFEFTIGEPTMDLDAAPYGRSRYPVEAQMTVNSSNATFSVLDRRTGRPWNQRVGSLRLLPPARDESNDD